MPETKFEPVLIGSTALHMHLPDKVGRSPKDMDFFSTEPIPGAEHFYRPGLSQWNWSGRIASLDELYTIKISHIFWELRNHSWEKHVRDIRLMEREGATFIPALYSILYPIWEDLHGKKPANLEKSPEEFFTATVTRVYDHDSIHESVAYTPGQPLFNKILRDNHEVAVSRIKFENLPEEEKKQLIREECYATALERKIIPSDYTADPLDAYRWALKKTITSFSKGWFPLYIALNLDSLTEPDRDYVAWHKQNSNHLRPATP